MSSAEIPIAGVYAIYNDRSDAVYVGSSYHVRKRLLRHFYSLKAGCHHNKHLQAAYNKHGRDAFSIEFLEEVMLTPPWVAEAKWLDLMKGWKTIYNMDPDTCSAFQRAPSPSVRKALSEAMTGRRHSEETKRKIARSNTGKKQTAEGIANYKAAMKGKWGHPNTLAAMHMTGAIRADHVQVYKIIALHRAGLSHRKIANAVGVHRSAVARLRRDGVLS